MHPGCVWQHRFLMKVSRRPTWGGNEALKIHNIQIGPPVRQACNAPILANFRDMPVFDQRNWVKNRY